MRFGNTIARAITEINEHRLKNGADVLKLEITLVLAHMRN